VNPRCAPHEFSDTDRATAELLAAHCALAVARADARQAADAHRTQLEQAIDSRDLIGQAKGILMHKESLTAEEAFEMLRRTSQDHNVKLVELARTLTRRHGELDDRPR
jgi:AmiR/NasT family two-component response regulator